MGSHRRHHTVSEGLQRNWAKPGKRIALIDKATRNAKPVGTHDAFVIPKLLTFQTTQGPSNDLEKAFGGIEDRIMPNVRRFVDGDRDQATEEAMLAVIALHWSRSRSMADIFDRVFDEVVDEQAQAAEDDEHLQGVFRLDQARLPAQGELRELINADAGRHRHANNLFADRIKHNYNQALEHLSTKRFQRVEIAHHAGVEFLFADSPVVLQGGSQLQPTAAAPCPLLEATGLWLPLSRTVGVTVTEKTVTDARVAPADAQILNRVSWAYATVHLGGRHGADLGLALGRPGWITSTSTEGPADERPAT